VKDKEQSYIRRKKNKKKKGEEYNSGKSIEDKQARMYR
jgi:hypothetical protein